MWSLGPSPSRSAIAWWNSTVAVLYRWICQVAGRSRGDDAGLAGLVCALNGILRPQANLCSGGKPKRLSEKRLRELIATAAAKRAETEAD